MISTGRAASTAIYRYLDAAGELGLPDNKEPHFWCDVSRYRGLYDLLLEIHTAEADAYWDLYAESKLTLDASCGYFFYIDETIDRLRAMKQRPCVVFLYREPVSRAISFFNELKRKRLTDAETLEEDLARERTDDLWWEYYYDNVFYDECFRKMTAYFDRIIAVNYDHFAQNQRAVLAEILHFLGLSDDRVGELSLEPVHSSRQALAAVYAGRSPLMHSIATRIPAPLRNLIASRIGRVLHAKMADKGPSRQRIEAFLPRSLDEFDRFRERIGHQDLFTVE